MTGQRRPEGPPDGQWAAERLLSGSWAEVFFMPSQDVAPYDFRDPPPGSRVPAQIWIEDGKLKSARWYYPTQDHGDHRQMPTIHHFHRDQRLPRPGELLKRFEAIKTENDVLRFATVWGPLGMCMCEPTGQPAGWYARAHLPHDDAEATGTEPPFLWASAETVGTWFELLDRLRALLSLASAIANRVQLPDTIEDAHMFGRVWNEPPQSRSAIDLNRRQVVAIASEMLQFGRVGWQLEWPGETPKLVLDAPQLAGRLVLDAVRAIGTDGLQLIPCAECGELFTYGVRRRFCEGCGTRASWRQSQRKRRDRK